MLFVFLRSTPEAEHDEPDFVFDTPEYETSLESTFGDDRATIIRVRELARVCASWDSSETVKASKLRERLSMLDEHHTVMVART